MDGHSGFQQSHDGAAAQYHETMWRFCSEQVQLLVSSVVSEGDEVLDVACGTGFAALTALPIVGDAGRVVGTDINPAMLAMARTVPGGDGIGWMEASALGLPFDDDEFDAVLCAQSAQFFPDVAVGLREMARVTRPGGRLALTVWTQRADSPFLDAQMDMLIEFCGIDPAVPNGAFIDDERQVRRWFHDAGLTTVDIAVTRTEPDLPSAREFSLAHVNALPWSQPFFELSPENQRAAVDFVDDRLAQYATTTGMTIPFVAYLATATI